MSLVFGMSLDVLGDEREGVGARLLSMYEMSVSEVLEALDRARGEEGGRGLGNLVGLAVIWFTSWTGPKVSQGTASTRPTWRAVPPSGDPSPIIAYEAR